RPSISVTTRCCQRSKRRSSVTRQSGGRACVHPLASPSRTCVRAATHADVFARITPVMKGCWSEPLGYNCVLMPPPTLFRRAAILTACALLFGIGVHADIAFEPSRIIVRYRPAVAGTARALLRGEVVAGAAVERRLELID